MMKSDILYEACGSADTAVQKSAYQQLWDYLYRIAYQMTYYQPGAEAIAQDCAQRALIRVHEQRESCQEPKAFRAWSRRIVSNLVIDELRQRKRLLFDDNNHGTGMVDIEVGESKSLETAVLSDINETSLRQLLKHSPMSGRSRRVVIGRYFDEQPDDVLAQKESQLSSRPLRPSHIQVTRAKNIAKLREWEALRVFLDEMGELGSKTK